MAILRSHTLEAAWLVFAAANAVFILLVPTAETIPFHFIWVSLTILYGLKVWSVPTTVATTAIVCAVTGLTMGRVVVGGPQGWDELTEVPLMAMMFLVMVWHARRRQEALEHVGRVAERERDFVRDASHLLRTPITIAQGHAELMARDNAGTATGHDAEIVLDELRRLTTISDRMILLAGADNPFLQVTEHVDLDELLRTVVDHWQATANRAWRVSVEGSGAVLGSAERLRAALDALVENALDATREADLVSVSGRVEDGMAVIEVSDSGVGIEPRDLDRIFERYSRAGSRHRSGLGLGLPIVKAIVEAHGGSVAATSDPGRSTTFRIRIPALHEREPEQLPELVARPV